MGRLARISYMDQLINQSYKRGFNLKDVATHFEVSQRTIKNDIEYMRTFLRAPLVYHSDKKIYQYKGPFDLLSFARRDILLSYCLYKSISSNMNLLPLVAGEINRKLEKLLDKKHQDLSQRIIYELSCYDQIEINLFLTLIESMMDKKQCQILYCNAFDQESSFMAEPLLLDNYQGDWYLIAHHVEKQSLRVFKISRIKNISIKKTVFISSYSEEELEVMIKSPFGIFKSPDAEGWQEAVVCFYREAAVRMRHTIFHKKQKIQQGKDRHLGEWIEFTVPVLHFDELLGRVLQYADQAEVRSPSKFRQRWLRSIQAMADIWLREK